MKKDTSLIILYDSSQRILLQHRTDDAPVYPGMWAFFGGGVEDGESFLEAARREAKEELDYDFKKPVFIYERQYTLGEYYGTHCFFAEECVDKSVLVLGEGQGMKWVNLDEAKKLKTLDEDILALEIIFDMLAKGKF